VAALIEQEIGVETDLIEGKRGEFSVWVDDELIAQKDTQGFPSEDDVVAAVRKTIGSG
jgi:hypothetical protein